MGETVTLQKLLELQKLVWSFKIDRDSSTAELVAREQLKSIGEISRIVSFAIVPTTIYLIVSLIMYAGPEFIAVGLFGLGVMTFLAVRNFFRQELLSPDTEDYDLSHRIVHIESIIVALAFSNAIAFPLAFGQIPFDANTVLMSIGTLILGGFLYGSIPRAQTYFLAITAGFLAVSFVAVGGWPAILSAALMIFFTVAIDWIYRLFFFNFVQRHIHAAELKESAETVRLLLNDYAEQSSDWLWETDDDRNIASASSRFAAAAGQTIGELNGTALTDLFCESTERNSLQQLLDENNPIRDLDLTISVKGEKRWWRISGRPIKSATGAGKALRGVATDITAAKNAEDRVAHLAHFDSLTDLPNRALFNESLQRSISRKRDDQILAVLYLDIDHFKTVNDTMGHSVGDQVLRKVGNRLEAVIGVGDMVARLGGDEFAVALRQVDSKDDVMEIASEIIDSLSDPIMIDGRPVASGISVGMTVSSSTNDTAEELLKNADIALYKSKENGRGCATMFEASMRQEVQDRRTIELDLRTALKQDELELYYQPLVNVETGKITGYEALIRWNHPTKGLIMPNDFIPIAEETGIIVQLGEWIIRTALHELARWPEHLSVAVNLSPAQIQSPNLLPTIVNGLGSAAVDPKRLELEITESVLMNDDQSNVKLLHKIRSLGVRIALDDFGTGYSSLNYLRSFPFDKIKIDRCFVEDVDSREDCQAIIRAVTGLASSLGMVTTAEGVERDDQLSQLKQEGCNQVQGYLFSKAVRAVEVEGRANSKQIPHSKLENIDKNQETIEETAESLNENMGRKSLNG